MTLKNSPKKNQSQAFRPVFCAKCADYAEREQTHAWTGRIPYIGPKAIDLVSKVADFGSKLLPRCRFIS